MYSLVVLLEPARDLALPARLHRRRAPRAALAGAVRARARGRAVHPQLGALPRRWRCSSSGSALLSWRPAAERRARLIDGALGFGTTALLFLPWVPTLLFQAAHTGAPWSRKPDYEQITMEATHRLLGHTAWLVLVVAAGGGVVALVKAGRGRELTPEGRAVLAVGVVAVGTVLLAWTSSQFSPAWAMRYLAIAVPPFLLLAAAGLAPRAGSACSACVIVAMLWGYDGGRRAKSNVRAVAHGDRAEPGARRRRHLHPARAGAGAAPLPAAGPALRDADRLRHDVGVTDWRDGVERLRASSAGARPQADAGRAAPGSAARAGHADHLQHGPLERAVDQARALRSDGVQAVPSNDRRFKADTVYPPFPRTGPEPGRGDRSAQDALAGSGSGPPRAERRPASAGG